MTFKAANMQSKPPTTEQAAVSTGKMVPNANPFSKKRSMAEMTKSAALSNVEAVPQNTRSV